MLYYTIRGKLTNLEQADQFQENRDRWKDIKRVNEITRKFNKNIDDYIFVDCIYEQTIIIGGVIKDSNSIENLLNRFLVALKLDVEIMNVEECTFFEFYENLHEGADNDYVSVPYSVLEKYELRGLRFRPGDILWNERILCISEDENLYNVAEHLPLRDTLIPELDRIRLGKSKTKAEGHPVHYIIESDDRHNNRSTHTLLVKQLYRYGRIKSKRLSSFNPIMDFEFSRNRVSINDMYKVNTGGVVVADLRMPNMVNDDIANSDIWVIENLCSAIKKYSDSVLTIIELSKECTKIKELLFEHLGSMSFVEIKEEYVLSDEAKQILKSKAKAKHVRSDKKLMGYIKDGDTYLLRDLNERFDEWYREKLKYSVYPQYKNINMIKKSEADSKHKGKAYEELEEMIGLAEAKKVINNALDFYKAKKLFESKGIIQNTPSMHMVFTGNPGTAKTSVARLFAEIMRDNKVLSNGNLVEVGRSDLVGKYVGWTAPTVKRKFQEAKGGVLFIDEAYSLVDDRDGLYGDEAINTIVQEMENHRNELVVIFAGYPDKMETFLQKNPGLRSRIAFHVPFKDYDVDELCSIAENISKKKGLYLSDSAMEQLRINFEVARANSDFGNGRYVRNVIEKAVLAQASRLLKMDYDKISSDDARTICGEDIEPQEEVKTEKIRMGFCS